VPIHRFFNIAQPGTYNVFINTAKVSGTGIHTDANVNLDARYTGGGVGTATAVTTGGGVASNRAIVAAPPACQNDVLTSITVPAGTVPGHLTVSGWIRIVINGHVAGTIDRGFVLVSTTSNTDCGLDDSVRSYWRAQ